MDSMAKEQKCTANFTASDMDIFILLVKKYKDIVTFL